MSLQEEKFQCKELRFSGISASPGIAVGEGFVYRKEMPMVSSSEIVPSEIPGQIDRFKEAKETLEAELVRLRRKEIDQNTIDIIDAQIEMVRDPDLHQRVIECIEQERYETEYAINKVFESYLQIMQDSNNASTRERIIDIKDVRDRLIQLVTNVSINHYIVPGSIIISEELSPREVIQLSGRNIQGIIMDRGGKTSHASIIAHAMGIPCVVGVKKMSKMLDSETNVIVDGVEGVVIANPHRTTRDEYEHKLANYHKQVKKIDEVLSRPSKTKDGHPFILRANIEFVEELVNVEKFEAEGIGLVRTESIYLSKKDFEYLDKQKNFYGNLLENTGDYPVVIRLFDTGGDKFFNLNKKEKNPFLGWRGIRMLLDEKELLKDQLQAIVTIAGQYPGRVKILIPMVSSIEEIYEFKEVLSSVEEELVKKDIPIDREISIGVMVEVPGIALLADKVAPHVDFFSIGTNDLTQYTLAVDRGNELISNLYHQIHPAIWKLIQLTVQAARKHQIDISVCGELASYPVAAACLVAMGITDLSMSPASIPKVKSVLTDNRYDEMIQLSEQVLEAESVVEVEQLFKNWKT